ncbi:TPA: AAA family ATPase [Providencia rettgeri]
MGRLIVVKDSTNFNPDLGSVLPIAMEHEDGSFKSVNISDFPNSGIFISKEYQKIDDTFKDNELFIITDWYETDNEWKENKRKQKYYSKGEWAERLEHNALIPVIKMPMPDIDTGKVSLGYDLPKNISFFIEDLGKISGPFNATKDDDEWFLTTSTGLTPLNLPTDHIAEFDKLVLEDSGNLLCFEIRGILRTFITSLKKIERVSFEKVDYISASRLIKYYAKAGFGKGSSTLGKNEANKLTQIIDAYKKKNKSLDNVERLKRLESVLADFLDDEGYGKAIIEDFLLDNIEGKKYLDGYFSKNKDLLIKEKIEEIDAQTLAKKEQIQREINDISRILETRKKELEEIDRSVERARADAEQEVKRIQEQSAEQAHQSLLEKQALLMNQNAEIENKIKKNQILLEDIYEKNKDLKSVISLKDEIQFQQRTNQEKQKEILDLNRTLDNQRTLIASPQLGEKLTELKTLIQMLNGKPDYEAKNDVKIPQLKISDVELTKSNRVEFIHSLLSKFHSEDGRQFTYDEMINLVISTTQSFLTILSGPPGTGKTSTAIRLANALYIDGGGDQDTANFLNIAVGRGWVAGRDILGFYNSLKDVYQPSRSGLYQFLRNKDNSDNYLKLVLLDEANLSSVEHYWSDFLGMCDTEGAKRRIDLGIPDVGQRFLEVGSQVRFIATINNDSTTEKLSPRLIDRAPIIALSEDASMADISDFVGDGGFNGATPITQINIAFNISSGEADFLPDEQAALDQVLAILSVPTPKTSSIHISKRKVNAIRRYCFVANEVGGMRNRPLDYAIAQHILPAIEGYGAGFRERLVKLEQKLTDLDLNMSKKALKSIIEEGDSYADTYSYF